MPDPFKISSDRPLYADSQLLINRGIYGSKPKRINLEKAVVTLIRQVARRCEEPVKQAFLIEPEATVGSVHAQLREFDSLVVASHSVTSLLQHIRETKKASVWAVGGASGTFPTEGMDGFAQSLFSFKPHQQNEFLAELIEVQQELLLQKRDFFTKRMENLCVEQKPGKTGLLDIWEPSIASLQKSWQAAMAQKRGDQPPPAVYAERGYGFGALVLSGKPGIAGKALTWSIAKKEYDRKVFDLNTAKEIFDDLASGLKEQSNRSINDFKSVYISIPSPIIASHMRDVWVENSKLPKESFKFHDLIWGWHPVLSLMQFIARAHKPGIFLFGGEFPRVTAVIVEEAEA